MGSLQSTNSKMSNDESKVAEDNMERSIEDNIYKYKITLLSTWKKLLENKADVGLSIYYSIVFGTTSKANGSHRPTSSIFFDQNTDLKKQSSRFMDMLDTVIRFSFHQFIVVYNCNIDSNSKLNVYFIFET